MNDTFEHALPLGAGALGPTESAHVTHRFTCAPRRRLFAMGWALQGVVMVMAGMFLLSNVSIAPHLTMQVAILGGLLVSGGMAFAAYAVADMTSSLTIDANGMRGRFGWSGFVVEWNDLRRWRVSDHDDRWHAFVGAEFWPIYDAHPWSVPAAFLDHENRCRLRDLLRTSMPEKEWG